MIKVVIFSLITACIAGVLLFTPSTYATDSSGSVTADATHPEETIWEGHVDAPGENMTVAPEVIAATGTGSLMSFGALTSAATYAGAYIAARR